MASSFLTISSLSTHSATVASPMLVAIFWMASTSA